MYFFFFFTIIFKPILVYFQRYWLMVLFLYTGLTDLTFNIFELFVKSYVLKNNTTESEYDLKIVLRNENFLKLSSVKLGIAAKRVSSYGERGRQASDNMIKQFRKRLPIIFCGEITFKLSELSSLCSLFLPMEVIVTSPLILEQINGLVSI